VHCILAGPIAVPLLHYVGPTCSFRDSLLFEDQTCQTMKKKVFGQLALSRNPSELSQRVESVYGKQVHCIL
jgi:hypothetical protein